MGRSSESDVAQGRPPAKLALACIIGRTVALNPEEIVGESIGRLDNEFRRRFSGMAMAARCLFALG
jgi:hypothetical protein